MAIIIGSARIDERGKASGGKAGDQKQTSSTYDTKGEVSMQAFYVHQKGWYILRPKSVALANKMAERMMAACNNKHVGYDQGNRLDILEKGIDTQKDTECDCSSLQQEVVIEAAKVDPGNFTTEDAKTKLMATGLFEEPIAFVSLSKTPVYNGDVLVTKTKDHIVTVVSGNPRNTATGKGEEYNMNTIGIGSRGKSVKVWQVILGYTGTKIDGIFGKGTLADTKVLQKRLGLKEDGVVGKNTWKAGLESI